jgi:ABC-type glycerol-3-phosphate transport system substrate-binding protein
MAHPQPGLTLLGKVVVAAIVVGSAYGAWYYFGRSTSPSGTGAAGSPTAVTIGVAYGTEKQRWLQSAAEQFAATRQGRGVRVELIPMGSLEAAQALLRGDERIHVWSPASALYKESFVSEWTLKYNKPPIVREESLALTPMVFVMWDERHRAFVKKYQTVSFRTIAQALEEKAGWNAIASRSDWGLFKFGHTHPNQSNSGLMTLVLMAFDYRNKCRDLELKDILDEGYQDWMRGIERAVTGLSNSTGNMMRDMVLKGPSSYDALFVYESVVVDYLKNAEGRWGQLRIDYPQLNMWNDNPYYVLDAPWSSGSQRRAAEAFLDFLMSEPIQKQSLGHGFRPGNPAVSIKTPDSPFTQHASFGLRVDLTTSCEPPNAAVISNLLASWQRGSAR